MLFLFAFLAILVPLEAAVPNRAVAAQKCVKFGVTFYTAAELQPIMTCCEPYYYSAPNDTASFISNAKTCVINNSASKAVSALSLYSNFNSCTDANTILSNLTNPFLNQTKKIRDLAYKALVTCKSNSTLTGTALQNSCVNKVYGKVVAAVTKSYVNTVCKAMYNKCTSTQWTCVKKYAPQVANVTGYPCFSLTK